MSLPYSTRRESPPLISIVAVSTTAPDRNIMDQSHCGKIGKSAIVQPKSNGWLSVEIKNRSSEDNSSPNYPLDEYGCKIRGTESGRNMMKHLPGLPPLLARFPLVIRQPVQWGDMDATGRVSLTAVYREFIRGKGVGRILKKASVHLTDTAAIAYPDTLWLGARTTRVEADRFRMEYIAISEATGEVGGSGDATIVTYDHRTGTKAAVPEEVLNVFKEVEGHALHVIAGNAH
ncbi:hypothetical protein BC830DRAFT_1083537 [Chytriomyces sp. MP71]|nr:hypothetical protein BC830DRAFT_1083537 [Chytriomyces sp. MP71]